MQVMLLGFILLGRSLEERARIKASSDMNELLVSFNVFEVLFIPWIMIIIPLHGLVILL